jgi:hypothetical protein
LPWPTTTITSLMPAITKAVICQSKIGHPETCR